MYSIYIMWPAGVTVLGQTCNPEVTGLTLRWDTKLGKLFTHMCFCSTSSTNWYRLQCREGYRSYMWRSGPPPICKSEMGSPVSGGR